MLRMRYAALTVLFVVFTLASPGGEGLSLDSAATGYPPEVLASLGLSATPPERMADLRALGTHLLLRGVSFDPVTEGVPPSSMDEIPASRGEPSEIFLVQFRRDLSQEERERFEGPGLRFLDAVPSHGYLVRADAGGLGRLRAHPDFRWEDRFRARYKVDPALLTLGWRQDVVLEIRFLPGENAYPLIEALGAVDPGISFVSLHGGVAEGTSLRIQAPPENLARIAGSAAADPSVWSVDPWFPPQPLNDQSVWVVQSYDTVNKTNYALSATFWNHGLTGTGQWIAACDTGVDTDSCSFRFSSSPSDVTDAQSPPLPQIGTVDASKKVVAYYVLPGASAYDGTYTCPAGNLHGTHVCGSILGDNFVTPSTPASGGHDAGDGMAPNARLIFQDAGREVTGCLDGLAADNRLIFQQAYDAGARIHSDSWGSGTGGTYVASCQLVDRFTYEHEDFLLFFAAGNDGSLPQTIGTPAAAKNCVTVGATTGGSSGANSVAPFSSRGPCADGRTKPDVCAPGWGIVSALGDTSHSSGNCATTSKSGTSMATPTAAGAAALLRQYLTDGFYPTGSSVPSDSRNPTAALLKAMVLHGAVDIGQTSQGAILNSLAPDQDQGWGRVCLDTAAFFSTPSRDSRRIRIWDRPNASGLATGEIEPFQIQVASGQALKATLVWTDPPASSLSGSALVNDLDLELRAPGWTALYRGNNFSGGQSLPDGVADRVNNVEEIFLPSPASGTWTVRVRAHSVPGTPIQPYSGRQGYALVLSYADCENALIAPSSLTAADSGSTGVDLDWDPVPGASTYQIYGLQGDCGAAPGAFRYLGQTAGTSFTDALADGGYAYAYRVRAADACAEGPASPCATATYSGNCARIPSFGGIASAVNDLATGTCDVLLSWAPASPQCPLAPTASYNLYRGTDPYFVPGPSSLLLAGFAGTSYRDESVLPGRTYFYTVRAEDGTTLNGGPANGGNEEGNLVVRSATPTSATFTFGTWSDAGGDAGRAALTLEEPWRVTNQQNHTVGGAFCYHAAPDAFTYPSNACASATTDPIPLQEGSWPVLSYWVRYNVENRWDGAVVELSADDGETWSQLAPAGGYPSDFGETGANPSNACAFPSTQGCFGGPPGNGALTPWARYTHDLTAYAGTVIRLRWRFSSDAGAEFEGFYLDDIAVTFAGVPDECLTSDGLVSLDRPVYRCAGDTVAIRVTDLDLAGKGEQAVAAASGWEVDPESVTLKEDPPDSGRFVGTIATVPGAPAPDGLLSLRDGDTLAVTYMDEDDGKGGSGVPKVASGLADCLPPTISDVRVTDVGLTFATVRWATTEPSDSHVAYGPTSPPGNHRSDLSSLLTEHALLLTGLSPCTDHLFGVASADAVGNVASDDLGGDYYRFATLGKTFALGPDGAEAGPGGWAVSGAGTTQWHIDTCRAAAGSHAWKAGADDAPSCSAPYANSTDAYLTSPPLNLGVAGHGYRLRFAEWYASESSASCAREALRVQISPDGGTRWITLANNCGSSTGWVQRDYDLSPFVGTQVVVRFWFHSDASTTAEGWYLDDIEVASVKLCAPELRHMAHAFSDTCASGGTGGDGVVDPGETLTLSVTLKNLGPRIATGVWATLTTPTPGVTIADNGTLFPDIPGQLGTGGSLPGHFSLSVDPSVPCGTQILLDMRAGSGQGTWTDQFSVPVGTSTPVGGSLLTEGFDDATFPPTGWTVTDVNYTQGNWLRATGTHAPAGGGTAAGPGLAYFNARDAGYGSSTRLAAPALTIPPEAISASLTLWMYHEPGFLGADDLVQVQASSDGAQWVPLGDPLPRYGAYAGWWQHAVDLTGYCGQGPFQVGFFGFSEGGNDCHIDEVAVVWEGIPACAAGSCAPGPPPPTPREASPAGNPLLAARGSGTSVAVHFTPGCGATTHTAYWGRGPIGGTLSWTDGACGLIPGGSFDPGPLAPGQWLYFIVASQDAGREGSYGTGAGGAERPEASLPLPCDKPQDLGGSCP